MNSKREKIVVLGMMSLKPVAGVAWQTVHYLAGLERLGYESWYVEAHRRTPASFASEEHDGARRASDFVASTLRRFGLGHRWAFHALHSDGSCYGITEAELRRLYREAALVINLHGGTVPLPEHTASQRLVYLETDPVEAQVKVHDGDAATLSFLRAHQAHFSFGENFAGADCGVPRCREFDFRPTRQPVVLDFWAGGTGRPGRRFTTVGNWRQGRTVRVDDRAYRWSKHLEFRKFIDLPARTGREFELALSNCSPDEQQVLRDHGWAVQDGLALSRELDAYRSYIAGSHAEFTVAKEQNVRLRSGWFSDRSATYLAAGRPVVTQDTAFANVVPTGEGLHAFATLDEAVEAVDRVNADYDKESRAALAIAREHFDSDVVLKALLAEAGV